MFIANSTFIPKLACICGLTFSTYSFSHFVFISHLSPQTCQKTREQLKAADHERHQTPARRPLNCRVRHLADFFLHCWFLPFSKKKKCSLHVMLMMEDEKMFLRSKRLTHTTDQLLLLREKQVKLCLSLSSWIFLCRLTVQAVYQPYLCFVRQRPLVVVVIITEAKEEGKLV